MPAPPPTTEDDELGSSSAIGLNLFTPDGELVRLSRDSDGNLWIVWPQTGRTLPWQGGTLLTAANTALDINGEGTIAVRRALSGTGLGSSGSSGDPQLGQRQAFESEQAAIQRAWEEEQARLDREYRAQQGQLGREFESAENQKAREEALRLNRLNAADNLVNTIAQLQQQARQYATDLFGKDPFRGAAAAQGRTQFGTSPVEAFRGGLQQFANTEVAPVAGTATTPELEQRIQSLSGMVRGQPTTPAALSGLAEGGTLVPGEATLVGEGRHGEGIKAGTAEVMMLSPDGRIEIVPLTRQAQSGGSFETSIGAIAPLRPLWEAAGFTQNIPLGSRLPSAYGGFLREPVFTTGDRTYPTPAPMYAGETFRMLGTRPRVIYNTDLGLFNYVDQDGNVQIVGDAGRLTDLGLNPGQAVSMSTQEIRDMGFRPNEAEPFTQGSPLTQERTVPFGEGGPLFVPLGGVDSSVGFFLPDPRLIANTWGQLDDDTRRLTLSAYGLAGRSAENVLSSLRFHTPTGSFNPRQTAGVG